MVSLYDKQKALRRMAELLRAGAIMLKETCPICGLPLFKLKSGEVVCPIHGPVRVVSSEAEAISAVTDSVLSALEKVISQKISQFLGEIARGDRDVLDDITELRELIDLLERVERVRSLKVGPPKKGVSR